MTTPVPEFHERLGPIIAAIRETWKTVGDGAYYFKRGPINYATWPYESWARTVSVQIDERSIMRKFTEAQMTFELSARLSDAPDGDGHSLDDGLLDEMTADLVAVLRSLARQKYPGQSRDSLFASLGAEQGTVLEFYDMDAVRPVQGITFSFPVSF